MEVSYLFYQSPFGGQLDTQSFNRFRGKAAAYVRQLTCGRSEEAEDTEPVLLAICEAIDCMAQAEQEVASESNDGVSVSYHKPEPLERRLRRAVERQLSGTGLLYRGCE